MGLLQEEKGQLQDAPVDSKGHLQEAKPTTYHLKKHVATIHSANKLTLIQRKIANALLYNAYNTLSNNTEHSIHVSKLCQLIGYNSNEQRAIKKALMSLISTVVEWNLVDRTSEENRSVWNASSIISEASITGPVCTYSYSNKMRELLYRPEMYGRLNMHVQAMFKSSYGLALYENCIRYQNIMETPWFDIVTFRRLMGVDESKYKAFKDFRKRVIDIAVREVSQYADLSLDYQLKKVGRSVTAIKFYMTPKAMPAEPLDVSADLKTVLIEEFGFTAAQVGPLLEAYSADNIFEKIALVKASESYRQGRINNLAQYLQSALKHDYQAPKSSYHAVVQQQQSDTKTQDAESERQQAYQRYVETAVMKSFEELSEAERAALLLGFESSLEDSFYLPLYLKEGLENIVILKKFIPFFKEQQALDLQSFEQFNG